MWYRHLDPTGGTNTWAADQGAKIGTGWNMFSTIVSGGDGVIYGVQPDGDLLWYRHLDPLGGTDAWAADQGAKIGTGWNAFL